MTGRFNRDDWWAAEQAARLVEENNGHAAMTHQFEQLRGQVSGVFKDCSVATRITVLTHLLVEAAALPFVSPGNVLEEHDLKEAVKMLKHSLDVQARKVLPRKLASSYGVRLINVVQKEDSRDN